MCQSESIDKSSVMATAIDVQREEDEELVRDGGGLREVEEGGPP